jgi:hypothetical protein
VNRFDESTVDEIGRLLCGDDGPLYRKGWELQGFLRRAGIADVPEYDGSARRAWVNEILTCSGDTGDPSGAHRVALRLADPREYATEEIAYHATRRRLDEILLLEGLRITRDSRGHPEFTDIDTGTLRVELKVSMDQVVSDPALALVIQQRLDEARLCHDTGAYIAAVIMLGSLLEGVLLAAVSERLPNPPRSLDRMGLHELIDLAHRESWIQVDVKMGSELIRSYRNLVHPLAQVRMGAPPDSDTLDICWPVVNATLNDLAASTDK